MRVVIVGGVAGGMSAATRLRRLDETAEIIILEKGPHVSFANCGLPYYIGGEIKNRQSLLVQTPERLRRRFNLDVRTNHEVIRIIPEEKVVIVRHEDSEFRLSYDKLILSPGAEPIIPPLSGIDDAPNCFVVRNVPDVDRITSFIEENNPKEAVVIGAGFIGLEMAENLVHRGLKVTVVEKAPQVLPPLDYEMAKFIEDRLVQEGVKVILNQGAERILDQGRTIQLEDGTKLASELIILSVGVRPQSELAKAAGIELGIRGGIKVDESYETSIKDIYAVGDAMIATHNITNEDALIALASPANRQGRQVADIIGGLKRKNRGSLGTSIVRVFDLVAASTGLSERQAKVQGLNVDVVHINTLSHASYFPGAEELRLKLVFNPETGKLYGAQAIGQDGVDKRIDVLATAIKAGLTVEDLPELELTYAPPFGSAKDPVNLAGYAALNVMEGLTDTVQWHELKDRIEEGYQFIDVRSALECHSGSIPGSKHIPLDTLRDRLHELDPKGRYIVFCYSGQRSYLAERLLKQHGFVVKNFDGSYDIYRMVYPEGIQI